MTLPLSNPLCDVLDQAEDIAHRVEQPLSTSHMLLALFTTENPAAVFLNDQNVTVDQLLDQVRGLPEEPEGVLDAVYRRSERIATGSNAETIHSIHLLAALVRHTQSQAYRLLDAAGVNVSAMRATVMSYATGALDLPGSSNEKTKKRQERSKSRQERSLPRRSGSKSHLNREDAPSPISFHPSLGLGRKSEKSSRNVASETLTSVDEPEESAEEQEKTENDRRLRNWPQTSTHTTSPSGEEPDAQATSRQDGEETHDESDEEEEADTASDEDSEESREENLKKDSKKTAQSLGARLFSGDKPDDKPEEEVEEEADEGSEDERVEGEVRDETSDDEEESSAQSRFSDSIAGNAEWRPDDDLERFYELNEEEFPHLSEFGRNVTLQAARGDIDRVIGRDDEIFQLIDILGKRRSNNPILVGEPGVGKTAIVEGLAREFVEFASSGRKLGERVIVELELGRILSGTQLRGSFSERLIGIKDEVEAAEGDIIVFLDEVHSWMDAGGGGDGADAAGELKTALARGKFPCIGATTLEEFRKFVEADAAFERRFEMVLVEEPDVETAVEIVNGIRDHYEDHHDVSYTFDAVEAAVRMSHRYVHDRRLPDKAIGVMDLAGSRAARTGKDEVDKRSIAEIVAEVAGIPADRLTRDDRKRILSMERQVGRRIVGQRHVIEAVSEVIRRNYAGFRSQRPIGSLLFLGPTGVGKTETVKVLADFLFHDRDAVVQIDMSEYMKSHAVSRFVGAPPGYVGYDQGGQLTEAIRRRPYQIVLLDEIEKAHPDVLNVLLQLFEEGRLTDGHGREVDFSNAVVVMTSNLGAEVFEDETTESSGKSIGFGLAGRGGRSDNEASFDRERLSEEALTAARKHFPPELWNRIDERLVFMPLTRSEVAEIARLQLKKSARRIASESGIGLEFDDAIVGHLIDNGGYDPELGARPMRQTIQRLIEGEVARLILEENLEQGELVQVGVSGGEIDCRAEH